MTAPLGQNKPIVVPVALGVRAYDIIIGRGLLASLGERIKTLRPGARVAIVTDETVAAHHLVATETTLKADIDVLLKRTKRRNDRPLVEKIKDLLPVREPIYAQADIIIQSRDEPHDTIIDEIMGELPKRLGLRAEKPS